MTHGCHNCDISDGHVIPLCQGMNIMSVDVLSEIMVTVGGERCTIDLGNTTDTVRDLV